MNDVTSTRGAFASNEENPRFDLAYLEQSLNRPAHRPVSLLDRHYLLRNVRAVAEALEDEMSLSVIAARCEGAIWAAARFIRKVEMRKRAWNR